MASPEPRDFFEERNRAVRGVAQGGQNIARRNDFFEAQQRLLGQSIMPGSAGAGTSFLTGLSSVSELDKRLVAEKLFPNLPDEERMARVGVSDGRVVFLDDEGQIRYADSGFGNRASRLAGEAVPATVGGIAGSVLGTPLLGGALGAGAGEGLRQVATGAMRGEPVSNEQFLSSIGVETVTDLALGKLFTVVGSKIAGARARGAKLDDLNPQDIARAQDEIFKKTGIRVDLAQVTGRASIQNLRDWSARFPNEAADIMRSLGNLQSEQAQQAVQNILDLVIKTGDAGALGSKVTNAADMAIQAARVARKKITDPLYEAAFNGGLRREIDISPIISELDNLILESKGPIRSALQATRNLFNRHVTSLTDKGKQVTEAVLDETVSGLHQTKIAIDALLEGAGETPVSGTVRHHLRQIRGQLVEELNDASPLYQAATRRWAEESARLVDPLENGVIGTIARLEDRNAARAGAMMLTGRNVSPREVALARRAITAQDPQAWNAALRLFLDNAYEKAATETQGATIRNFAGKFRQAVFGSPRQRSVMNQALGPDVAPLFDDVMGAFEMIANMPVVGSNTARDQLITRGQEGALVASIRFVRQFGTNVLDRMGERSAGRYAIKVAEAMTDPQKIAQLKELRKLSPSAQRSLLIMGVVTGNAFIDQDN